MTEQPQRPDIACDLVYRAEAAREHRRKLPLALLSAAEIGMGRHQDRANARVLRRSVGDHSWPGRSLVGEEAAEAAWQIALYADPLPDFQRLALRLLADAVVRGEAPLRQWAPEHSAAFAGIALKTVPEAPQPDDDTRSTSTVRGKAT
ncbi:hypothetical protein ACO0M4_05905 [Streptomyces sp. RGM 3693]|uniref:hypothetical protein n=1 Tax=Streptomyces sp. RGM 3693 TaxID=3413284 RepID=UPI003D2E1A55